MGDLATGWFGRPGIGGADAAARSPWERRALDVPDAGGPVTADDGRMWQSLGEALVELVAEGWRLADATLRERNCRRPSPLPRCILAAKSWCTCSRELTAPEHTPIPRRGRWWDAVRSGGVAMANAAIFIGWGQAVSGREQQALRVFQEAVQYWTRQQQQGAIESFEPIALEPHGGDLAGCCLIKGDRQQLSQLRYSDAWQRLNARAEVVVTHFGAVDAHIGEGLQRLFGEFQRASAELGGQG